MTWFPAARQNVFLSTLSLRRATGQNLVNGVRLIISIHALLAESDSTKLPSGGRTFISIHALLAESDYAISCFLILWS